MSAEALGQPTDQLHTGAHIPLIGFGTWGAGDEHQKVADAVKTAIKAGYRHIDCAELYGNLKETGQAINESIKDGTVKREDLFITSKIWNTNHEPQRVAESAALQLKVTGLTYFDLMLVHWPLNWEHTGHVYDEQGNAQKIDPFPKGYDRRFKDSKTSLQETWRAFEKLVDEGKTKHIGISNYTNILTADLLRYCRIKPAVNQVELHPYLAQESLVKYHQAYGIHVSAYTPLGRAGRIAHQTAIIDDPVVKAIAEYETKAHNYTGDKVIQPAHVLIRWAIQRNTSVLPKSSTPERIVANLKNCGTFGLNEEQMSAIFHLDHGLRYNELSLLTGDMGVSLYPTLYEGYVLDEKKEAEKEKEAKTESTGSSSVSSSASQPSSSATAPAPAAAVPADGVPLDKLVIEGAESHNKKHSHEKHQEADHATNQATNEIK